MNTMLVGSVFLLLGLSVSATAQQPRRVVHISLEAGSDSDLATDGSAARPFRTLRGWASRDGNSSVSGITFGPGVHSLVDTGGLALDTAGSAAQPFVVKGAGRGTTLLTAAVRVTGFVESGGGGGGGAAAGPRTWKATLPPNTTYFRQLFVRQPPPGASSSSSRSSPNTTTTFSRRHTARSPEMQYDHANSANPKYAVVYKPGQVRPSYHNQADVLATLYHCWTATTHHIREINASNLTLTLLRSPHVDIPRCEHASGRRFYVEDAREELDEPGEFYYDRATRELTYLPEAGESLHAAGGAFEAWAPQLIAPVALRADFVELRDLSVVHAAADMSGFFEGDCDGQAASNLLAGGAVTINGSIGGAVLANVEVAHVGGFGVVVAGAARDCSLSRLHVHDVGAGAVNVQRSRAAATTGAAGAAGAAGGAGVRNLSLVDSELEDGGHVYKMGPGLLLQECHRCEIAHNRIHHFYYSGISTGYAFADGHISDTAIEFNELHTLGQGALSDMGCVYVWGGHQPGLLVNNNLCHNVSAYSYGAWGLYNDQTTHGVAHTNNVVHSTEGACYHDHEGFDVTLANNIFAMDGTADGAIKSAAKTATWHAAFNMSRNIIYSSGAAALFSAGGDSQWALSSFDFNVYWRAESAGGGGDDVRLFPDNQTLPEWQAHGVAGGKLGGEDKHSVVADPHFANAAAHNYTLQEGSPALALGFVPIDLSTVGPRVL